MTNVFRTNTAVTPLLVAAALGPGAALPAQTPADPPPLLSTLDAIEVKRFGFEANTAFSDDELAAVVARYQGRVVTLEQLDAARQALTRHYVVHGYINSGAILDDQTVTDGTVTFGIIEGQLAEISLRGHDWLRDHYILDRIRVSAQPPLNFNSLKDQLELLRQDPNIEWLRAELRPGVRPGEGVLDVHIQEADAFDLGVAFNNHRSPSIGAERFELLASHTNVTGHGDRLALNYGITKNGVEDIDFAGVDLVDVSYALPVTAYDTTISVRYARSDTLVVEEPFDQLDIQSETREFILALRQPVYRTPTAEVALWLAGERRENVVFLQGDRVDVLPGARDGESNVTVVRLGQEFSYRHHDYALAAVSSLRFGIDALDATTGGSPDANFFSWQGQAQYIHRLGKTQNQVLLRVTTQIADNPLLAIERMALGGVDTVRGYRENQVVRDNGVALSFEGRFPVLFDTSGQGILSIAPFVDLGYGWNDGSSDSLNIASAGVGVLFRWEDRLDVQAYWGYPFRDFDDSENDVQDLGLHFSVTLFLF